MTIVSDTSRRGDKISPALNDKNFPVIVSPISIVFSTNAEKLLPQYLMLFFNRSEFDRYARFHSWGSAREVFTWKDLCEVEIPIPDIKIQRSIAAIYEILRTRKKFLERLKTQIKNICPMRPIGDGKGGTYFDATDCGKTYTMLFLARLIIQRDNETFRNPMIIILTDREDLDTQTSELFVTAKKFLHKEDVRSIESRANLQATLKNRPSSGVYIITIQKFCEELGELPVPNLKISPISFPATLPLSSMKSKTKAFG